MWRIATKADLPELYYGIKIRDYFFESAMEAAHVRTVVVSSVVPGLTEKIRNVVRTLFEKEPILLGPKMYDKLPMGILNPYEIGSDLVSNAAAAYFKHKRTCITMQIFTSI